jgi:hypothetical protein
VVSDAELASVSGKFVPQSSLSNARVLSTMATPVNGPQNPALGVGAPSLAMSGAALNELQGQVVALGISFDSEWLRGGSGYEAALAVGINPQNQTVTSHSWSQTVGNGLGSVPTTGTINGSVSSTMTGIVQSSQVAGNGDAVVNQSSIEIGTKPIAPPTGTQTNGCGASCTVTSNPQALGVSISAPGGSVSQLIGSGQIRQNAQLVSDFNQVVNSMKVQVQVAPVLPTAITPSQLSALMQMQRPPMPGH